MIDNILNAIATMVILFAMVYAPAVVIYLVVKQIYKAKQ
jgi:hypothetical protein